MRHSYSNDNIYRDPLHRKIGGVCAGLARYLDVPRFLVRLIAVISLIIFPHATLLAYGLAYFILEERHF